MRTTIIIMMALFSGVVYAQNTQGTIKKQDNMSCDSTCLIGGQTAIQSINTATANGTYNQSVAPQQPQPQQTKQCQGGTQPVYYYGTNTPVYNGVTPVCCPNGYTQQYVGGGQLLYIGTKNACIPIQTN